MQNNYNPQTIEIAAQKYWDENKSFIATEDFDNSSSHSSPPKEKFYCISMLPYPSGQIHMGHVRNYAIGDVIARYMRMRGKNVLQPLGWDAFGLPAENAALEHKLAPAAWTYHNIAEMRTTIKRLGFAIDWTREIATCKSEYYRWEQWLFLRMYEKGLVYKKKSVVNWDPVDQTVLANEQVVDGRGWRSGALVERREIAQWFLKITAYAEELLNDLDKLTAWPEEVRIMQRNWIGRSEGVELNFELTPATRAILGDATINTKVNTGKSTVEENTTGENTTVINTKAENTIDKITVFTTRPDTLFGVTYLAIATEHHLALAAATKNNALAAFIKKQRNVKVAEAELATMPKEGLDTGLTALHPISGASIPVWVANFVLMEYGSGAVMSVPAHDQRDFEFAQQYGLAIKPVIEPRASANNHIHGDNGGNNAVPTTPWDYSKAAFTAKGVLVNSGEFSGLSSEDACNAIATHLEQKGAGTKKVHYRLRDWGVSRQRYWGTPIPMINCPKCGTAPINVADLPVVLPENVMLDSPQSPLTRLDSFLHTTCPKCGSAATRETDTFDTFMESSWYYARYCCPDQNKSMFDERTNYWMPVNQYIGGIEHAIMHLLYARFIYKVMRDEGLVKHDEPFLSLLTQGMVLKDGSKMSKSKGNTVSPQTIVEKYGADTARLFIIFAAPPTQALEWSNSGVEGAYRFLKRLWNFAFEQHVVCQKINQKINKFLDETTNKAAAATARNNECNECSDETIEAIKKTRRSMHLLLQQATDDINKKQFNTVVSAAMKLLNLLQEQAMIEKDASKKPSRGGASSNNDNGNDSNHERNDNCNNSNAISQLTYEGISILLRLLAPITPHITHHLWQELQFAGDIIDAPWPHVDVPALKQDSIDVIVQVNGKYRAKITVPQNSSKEMVQQLALANENVQRFIELQHIKKIIVVPNKLVNIVS